MAPSPKGDVFADERWLSIQGDRQSHCIYAEWKGFANSAEFRASTMRILQRGLGKIASEQILRQDGMKAFSTRTFTTVSEAMEWAAEG